MTLPDPVALHAPEDCWCEGTGMTDDGRRACPICQPPHNCDEVECGC